MRFLGIIQKINSILPKKKAELFLSLDELPFYNWRKMHETGELKYLIKKKGRYVVGDIKKSWHLINNEFLTKFGLDDKSKRVVKLKKRYALALAKFISTQNKVDEMEVDLLEKDVENVYNGQNTSTYSEIQADIEESRGIGFNEKETSTLMFYVYLKQMRDKNMKAIERLKSAKNGKAI